MLGCDLGTMFKVAVAGGSYQEGLTVHLQGVPPGMLFTEEQIYQDLLLRKPGQGELTSPRREPDIPIIYNGVNAADTMPGFKNAGATNGTPLVILIPNLDRHFEHIEQYQVTNRTPRPGHASYASYQKYGHWDDAIGAGIFSGRYTSTIVAAGAVAKAVLATKGIEVTAYVKEAAGVVMPDMPLDTIRTKAAAYRKVRKEHDPIWRFVYQSGRIKPGMRFLEKTPVLAEVEKMIGSFPKVEMDEKKIRSRVRDSSEPVLPGPGGRRRDVPTRSSRSRTPATPAAAWWKSWPRACRPAWASRSSASSTANSAGC